MNAELEKTQIRVQAELIVSLIDTIIICEVGIIVGEKSKIYERNEESKSRRGQLIQALFDFKTMPLT